MKKDLISLFLFASLLGKVSEGTFDNSGTMRSRNSNLHTDHLKNTGTIEGLECVTIKCDKLSGNGLIRGPKITIAAIECLYTGTIECEEACIVITNTPESELKFSFQGSGQLVVKKLSDLPSNL